MLLLGTIGMFAQGPGGGTPLTADERAERTLTALTEKIEVSEAQKTELTAIFKNFYEELMQNRGDWEKMRALATARDEKVKAVLADDAKYEAYGKFLAEQRKRGRRGGGRK